jgi:H/ACA ribonucleoprotein complex subunit 3
MRSKLRKCQDCGRYTLKDICLCGSKTIVPQPPRFSPQDRFGEYRRKAKNLDFKDDA